MSQALDLKSIDAVLPQLSALPITGTVNGQAPTPSQSDTTTIGIKIPSMVILAAQELANGYPSIQIEWVTDSIFVARGGQATHSSGLVQGVREICVDNPPSSFEEVVTLFVNESNQKLGTVVDATDVFTFIVAGRLHREHDCHLFLVERDYNLNPSLYVSKSGDRLIAPTSRGESFFTDDVKTRLLQAGKVYDRASLARIVKEYFANSCVTHKTSSGRVTMVTVDERGFHVLESTEYDNQKRVYKESKYNGFCPEGYRGLYEA